MAFIGYQQKLFELYSYRDLKSNHYTRKSWQHTFSKYMAENSS